MPGLDCNSKLHSPIELCVRKHNRRKANRSKTTKTIEKKKESQHMDAEQSNEDAVGTSRSCHLNNNARQSYRKGRKSKRKEKKKKLTSRSRSQTKQANT